MVAPESAKSVAPSDGATVDLAPCDKSQTDAQPVEAAQGDAAPPSASDWRSTVGMRPMWAITAAILLSGVIWTVYGRGIHAPFIFDDESSVERNPSIKRLWPLFGDLDGPGPLKPLQDSTTAGRPLVNLSLALNYHLGEFDPVGYHIFNIIVHAISTILLFAIVRRVLLTEYFAERFQKTAGPLAFAVALVWSVHPLQTEAVEYITQRTELMMGCCYLATIYASLRYFAAPTFLSRLGWLALATAVCAAGMACKEVMVTAPVVVLLLERTFVSNSFRKSLRRSWPLYLGLGATWLLLLVLNFNGPRSTSAGFHLDVPAHAWWLTQTKVLLTYLKLVFWPWPLVIHYETPYLTTLGAAWPYAIPVALLGLVTLYLLWRGTATGFAWACVFLILSPTLAVPIISEIAAERRMYLPLAALITLFVVGGYMLANRAVDLIDKGAEISQRSRWSLVVTLATTLGVAGIFCLLSARRLGAYVDAITLWSDAVVHQPNNAMALTNLGGELVKAGRFAEAIKVYDAMLGPLPESTDSDSTPAPTAAPAGQSPEAIARAERLLKLNASEAEAHNNMGIALTFSSRSNEALRHFRKAVQINPQSAEAHMNVGHALLAAGNYQEAIASYETAIRLNPELARAHGNLGLALRMLGRQQQAVVHLKTALVLDPTYLKAGGDLLGAYAELGQAEEAIATAGQLIELARSQQQMDDVRTLEAWLVEYRKHLSQSK